MTRLAQVGHVAAKDVRETKWLLAGYAVVVALATASALDWEGVLEILGFYGPPLSVLLGMLVMAAVVQGDSPTRPDAPWATRPLYPSAIVGAKVAFAAIGLILLPALGQIAALRAHAVTTANIPGIVGGSIGLYARLLLTAAVVGALTSDLRALVVALLVTFFVGVWVVGALAAMIPVVARGDTQAAAMFTTIGAVGGSALLFSLYRTRDGRRRTVATGMACAAMVLAATALPTRPSVSGSTTLPMVSLEAVRTDSLSLARPNGFAVMLDLSAIDTSAADRLILVQPAVTLRLDNGKSMTLSSSPSADLRIPRPPEMAGFRWIQMDGWGQPQNPMLIVLTNEERRELETRRVTGITIAGIVTRWHPRAAAIVPLKDGERFFAAGRRFTVLTWTHSADYGSLELDQKWVNQKPSVAAPHLDELWQLGVAPPQIALFNDREKPFGLYLSQSGSSTGSSSSLVLPGPRVQFDASHLEVRRGMASPTPLVDDAWFNGVHLMVVEWIPTGAFRVRAEVKNP